MKKETILKVSIGISALLPLLVFAADTNTNVGIQYPGGITTKTLVEGIAKLLGAIAAIVAVVFIVLGIFKFATARGDPKAIDEAKTDLLWGGLGIVIALALFNINNILSLFGVSGSWQQL
jgi:heme/copper-type cytochrome/quinol oxidase subunit 2